jgi:hypothetical protein
VGLAAGGRAAAAAAGAPAHSDPNGRYVIYVLGRRLVTADAETAAALGVKSARELAIRWRGSSSSACRAPASARPRCPSR